ncbi:hypothetical protein [Actinoplanes utahensis]|uniref:hypothetical protein n=1 Tax=Actinoplanes utahensis TaxID=1869 RepID=UPI0036218190
MTTIGITGHIRLRPPNPRLVLAELVRLLSAQPAPHGVTCLAEGSDRLFAEALQACGGTFDVVLPVPADLPDPESDRELRSLLASARDVTRVAEPGPPEASYEIASSIVVERCDLLIAVWDGTSAGVRGGTAETVAWARAMDKPVQVVWPAGARRGVTVAPVPVG